MQKKCKKNAKKIQKKCKKNAKNKLLKIIYIHIHI